MINERLCGRGESRRRNKIRIEKNAQRGATDSEEWQHEKLLHQHPGFRLFLVDNDNDGMQSDNVMPGVIQPLPTEYVHKSFMSQPPLLSEEAVGITGQSPGSCNCVERIRLRIRFTCTSISARKYEMQV